MKTTAFAAASLAALAAAAPTRTINKRAATSECAQYASSTAGDYVLSNDLWGEANGSGSQCYTLDSSDPLGWTSTWSWSGGENNVKSYANAVYNGYTKSKLSEISSIPSKWEWSYTGDSLVADVSYDLFTSSTADGSNEYEIMVWLAALGGAGPISAQYGSDGKPVAVGSTTVGGTTFDFYKGSNGVQKQTYSFIASSKIESFSGDLNDFLTYLVKNEDFDDSQYLVSLGAGTEAFTGSNAVFKVSSYSVSVSTGGSGSTSNVATSSAAAAPASYGQQSSSSSAGSSSASYAASSMPSHATPVPPIATAPGSSAAASTWAPYPTAGGSGAASSWAPYPTAGGASVAPVSVPGPTASYSAPLPAGTASTGPAGGDCDVSYVYV